MMLLDIDFETRCQQVWVEAWVRTAQSDSCVKVETPTRFADECLRDFRVRFKATDPQQTLALAVNARLGGRVRALREGEVMGAYIDFDRTADKAWTPAEYLVRFGEYVSQRTAEFKE